ncbi:MAG: antibiotic biosynthesis monooxygenase [Gammaproteobacteria bacterium]|nr:antibiotic biosynthesis monooxygenase [Gammaproteobacteria bacterium]
MRTTIVYVHVKEEYITSFIEATRLNHENSVSESGNLRFDILQSPEDFSRFVLYEAYQSDSDAIEHKKTAHYLKWRDTVADWMASPREGVSYNGLFPRTDCF